MMSCTWTRPKWADDPALTGNYDFMLARVPEQTINVIFASKELRRNRDFVIKALELSPGRADREIVMQAVSNNGEALEHASQDLKANFEIVMQAVSNDGEALEHASQDLSANFEIVLKAVSVNGPPLRHASKDLQDNHELVMNAVSKDGRALEHTSEKLRTNFEIVMQAVSNNGASLRHASEDLKDNHELVMKAVSNDGWALEHASENLRADSEIVRNAMLQDPRCLNFAAAGLAADPDILAGIRWPSMPKCLGLKVSLMSGRSCVAIFEEGFGIGSAETKRQHALRRFAQELGLDPEEVCRSGKLVSADGHLISSLHELPPSMLHEATLILSDPPG